MHRMPDAVVLCGGTGLRLRPVIGEAAKTMAAVAGRPFLEVLFRQLVRHGFNRAILAVGYQKEAIHSYFGSCAFGLQLTYSPEERPLGTGGALRNSADLVETDSVLVMNGDSYTDVDLKKFVSDSFEAHADASVVVVPGDGRNDCGFVVLDKTGRVLGFNEKNSDTASPVINAGIYVLSRPLVYEIAPEREISLEREVLPVWIREGKHLRGFAHPGTCMDIGTPQRYLDAQTVLANAEEDASVLR